MATWYIIDGNLPFLYEFPERPRSIDDAPLGIWTIQDGNLPTKATFPPRIPIDGAPVGIWVIRDGNLPYKSSFPEKSYITDVPYGIWAIRDGKLPFKRNFPPMYRVVPWKVGNEYEFWYVGRSPWGYQIRKAWAGAPNKVQLMEDLGPSIISAALETDGLFEMEGESFLIHTEGIPWMFVVTNEGKLYAKKCLEDVHTAQLLATNVTKVAAVRGYKNPVFDVDSGITVAYLKTDGSAWMRTSDNSTFTHWEPEVLLDRSPNVNIQAFRLNDYRTAIFVEGVNRVFISSRYYIGGTSKTEYISVKLEPWANVCSFSMVGEPAEQTFKVERCWMEEDTKVRMHCNYPIVSFDPNYPNLTLTDDSNYSKLVEYYIQNGDLVCILDKPKYSSFNTIRIVIPSINHILYQITPQFKRTIPGGEYAVENKPVEEYINVSLAVSVGQLNMTERQDYNYIYDTEHINVDLAVSAGQLNTTEMQKLSYTYDTEHIAVDLAVSCGVLEMTQSGVTPV